MYNTPFLFFLSISTTPISLHLKASDPTKMLWIQTQQKYLDPDPFVMFGSQTVAIAGGYENTDLWRSTAGGNVQAIMSRPVWTPWFLD